jgi:hypothetical protein
MDNRTKIVIVLSREKEAKDETYLGQHPRMLKQQRHQKNFVVFFEISKMIVLYSSSREREQKERKETLSKEGQTFWYKK